MLEYSPVKAGIWYTVCNMLIKGIPFFTIPIFTRLLLPKDFGIYNIYLSYESILCIIVSMGTFGTVRSARAEYGENYHEYIRLLIILQVLLCISICPFLGIAARIFMKDSWLVEHILLILIIHSMSTSIVNIISGAYAISGKIHQTILMSFMMTFLNVGGSLAFILFVFQEKRYLGRILGTAIGVIFTATFFAFQYGIGLKHKKMKGAWRFALRMGIPLIPHQMSMTLLSNCDKLMIQGLVNHSAAGIYSLGVTLDSIVTVIVSSIDNAWAPWFFQNLELKKYSVIQEKNDILSRLFCGCCACIICMIPDVIKIMTASVYWDSIYAAIPLIVSVFINFMYLFAVNTEYYYKETWFLSFSTMISVTANIILNFYFIKLFGYLGAAYATCISKYILFMLHSKKAASLSKRPLVTNSLLVKELFFLIFISVLSLLLINRVLIRVMILFVLLLIEACTVGKYKKREV